MLIYFLYEDMNHFYLLDLAVGSYWTLFSCFLFISFVWVWISASRDPPVSLVSSLSFAPVQFSASVTLTAPMEAPLSANHGAPIEPFGSGKPTEPLIDYLHQSHNGTSSVPESPAVDSTVSPEEEEECLVDSQPMCFNENPFLVANRRGKGLPTGERILSGPPVGYGRQGKLQPWLFSKARWPSVVWRGHAALLWALLLHPFGSQFQILQ